MKRSNKFLILLSAVLCSAVLMFGCNQDTSVEKETDPVKESEKTESVENTETESEEVTEDTTEPASVETEPAETEPTPETVVQEDPTEEAPAETEAETEPVEEVVALPKEPDNINPLTGLTGAKDSYVGVRPLAIMINNAKISCPQRGIASADVLYECLVEGGYTRLMMLTSDYETVGEIGSVRSSRDYFLDFAADFDAIYFHAGGSPQAYEQMRDRAIDHVDGVNMYTPNSFYRDAERQKTMGTEHSLMITGERIDKAIDYWKIRTEHYEGYISPFNFVEQGKRHVYVTDALHVHIPYSNSNIVDMVYDETSGKYLRYQFNGEKHIDETTGEQLAFTNVILLFMDVSRVAGDASGRLEAVTTGSGDGYYIYGGKFISIKWSKETRDTPIVLTRLSGDPLQINRGNTFVSVIDTDTKAQVQYNYNWD